MATWDNWHLLLQHAAQPQQWKILAFYGHARLPLAGGQHRRLGLLPTTCVVRSRAWKVPGWGAHTQPSRGGEMWDSIGGTLPS